MIDACGRLDELTKVDAEGQALVRADAVEQSEQVLDVEQSAPSGETSGTGQEIRRRMILGIAKPDTTWPWCPGF